MFKVMAALVVLLSALWGIYLLAMPGARLIEKARRGVCGFPMPKEGSTWRKVLVGFYRCLGVIALAFSAFVIFMLLTYT